MWSLYKNGEFLEPLSFSNGKTQEDIVKEVLDAVKEGHKIIFIHGVCGTGKSAIALNIAKEIGKASIVVPGKSLQNQYKKDYENDKYLLGKNNNKLKISVITGRINHECPFLKERKIPKIKKEINATLDIFDNEDKKQDFENSDIKLSADVYDLPCKIEIKEKNWKKIKEYLKQNPKIDLSKFSDVKDVTRASIARVCKYWSPVVPKEYELKFFPDSRKKTYQGLKNTEFVIHQGKPGCTFYEQFNSYLDSDIIVFNSAKYLLESSLNRKPLTEVEIIDECDVFLDNFSNQKTINLDRLQKSLIYAVGFGEEFDDCIKELSAALKDIKKDEKIKKAAESEEIILLKDTKVYDILKIILNNPEFLSQIDDESYLIEVEEAAKIFEELLDEAYVCFKKRDNSLFVSIVTTNLAKRFKELADNNKILILMSGTLHSEYILKNIFGIEKFKIIQAETEFPGKIEIIRTGLEKDCRYANFSNNKVSRKEYLTALNKCVETSKKPALVHINAFSDLPSEREAKEYQIKSLITREELKNLQKNHEKTIEDFKSGKIDVLFQQKLQEGLIFLERNAEA